MKQNINGRGKQDNSLKEEFMKPDVGIDTILHDFHNSVEIEDYNEIFEFNFSVCLFLDAETTAK